MSESRPIAPPVHLSAPGEDPAVHHGVRNFGPVIGPSKSKAVNAHAAAGDPAADSFAMTQAGTDERSTSPETDSNADSGTVDPGNVGEMPTEARTVGETPADSVTYAPDTPPHGTSAVGKD